MNALSDIRERLAKIEATQDHQGDMLRTIDGKLDSISGRVRDVEIKSTTAGSLAGGVVSIFVALISSRLRDL